MSVTLVTTESMGDEGRSEEARNACSGPGINDRAGQGGEERWDLGTVSLVDGVGNEERQ